MLRRRAAIEPVIGHLKAEHRMGRNYLAHRAGDAVNAVLAAAGYNFHLLLRWLELLLSRFLAAQKAAAALQWVRKSKTSHGVIAGGCCPGDSKPQLGLIGSIKPQESNHGKVSWIDLSMEETSVCVLDGSGNIVFEGKTSSQPDALSKLLRAKAADAARIVLETGSLASWLWHELRSRTSP
jgi:hypothetical protein